MARKNKILMIIAMLICILIIFMSTIDFKLKSIDEVGFEKFEEDYLNIIEKFSSENDGQIVISKNEGLYEKNGCYMIDEKSFSRMTGVNITNSSNRTDLHYEDNDIQIKDNTILKQNGDIELLPQEMEYFTGSCAFPIQTVAEALGYKVDISNSEEEQSVTLTREFSTRRLIIKYSGKLDSCGAVAAAEGYNDFHIFQYKDEQSTANAFNYFKDLPYIEYVECDEVVTVEATKTESDSSSSSTIYSSWGAEAMGVANYTSHISSTVSTLPEIIIAVIDTGIDTDHEWFTNRIAAGGKNFSTSQKNKKYYEYEDDQGHGTHVSGIITDLTMDNVKILPIKVLNSSGVGYASSIALGINYVTSLKKSGRNIRALNMSLGGTSTNESSKVYQDSLSEAYDNGILPVVAAGNENTDVLYVSPANISCAITVAALANANNIYYRPYYSNYGSYVDVCAPGSAILSAKMGGGTVTQSGTSMASPHVAAAAALVFTEHSEYTLSQVENLLTSTAVDLGDTGKDKFYGYGMVNLRYIYADLLSDVTFSKNEFECTQTFNLTISHTSADTIIYYTTDGTIPTPENGIRYTSPIEVSRSVKIRAAAYVFDGSDIIAYSNPKEITYRFGNQDLENCFIVDDTTGGLVYYQGILEDLTVPQVIDGTTITTICSGAFTATNVVNVILPNTVIEIQNSAFRECKNLETVKALSVKSIGNYAFQSCSSFMYLNNEYFPELTKIGAYAFYQCANLHDISLSRVESIDAFAFYMKNTTPQYLTSIDLPSVKTIGDTAFYYAKYVTSVNLPKVEVVARYAFSTNDIRNLYLPKAIYLGNFSFQGNNRMTQADLPEAVYLGPEALAADTTGGTLSSVNIPKAKILGMYVIGSTAVKHIDLPSAETLLPLAFYNHPNLESFTAPNLKYVGSDAFGFCKKLTEANLPSVISLGNAFCNCSNLQKIMLSPCLEKMTYYSKSDRGTITALKDVPESCVIYYYQGTAFEGFYKTTGIKNPIVNLSNDKAFSYMIINGEVYITGINGEAPEELIIPSYINKMPVTKICEGAFEGCSSSIKLNVLYLKEIEEDAFKDCSNLTEVYLTRINQIGQSAFEGCSTLEKVMIDSILKIGAYAFNGCTYLKTITLPASIKSIGQKALGFASEELITGFVIYGDEDTLAQAYALENDIEFRTIFENIDGFYYDTYINEETGNEEVEIILVDAHRTGNVIIPESYNGKIVSKIGEEAFRGCLVTGVILPDTIKEIGAYAFRDCDFLESINLENIAFIGDHAFYGCSSLKYVNMPLVEELPNGVFSSCGSLKIADLSGATLIGQDVFSQCYELEKVICPNLVTLDAAFNMATSLKSVDTKNVVTIIGKAFIYCKSIEELYFPNLETITNGGVFAYCPSLKKVVIGEKLKSYVVDNTLDLADFTYYNVPVYGYSGSLAEEWASQCVNYNNTKRWEFTAIDDIDTLTITKDLANEVEVEYKSLLSLSVEAEGIGLTYQWYQTEDDVSLGIPIKDATERQFVVETTILGTYRYFVKVTDWKENIVDSEVCEVTIINSNLKYISVILGEHVSSPQNGIHSVNEGEDYQITFIAFDGYHISSILVDEVDLSEEELEATLINGYEFTNISTDHTIVINSAPNEDTEYQVYHYKQSLEVTPYEINGKYYELEEETLTGTTADLTMAVERTYEGFTAEAFEQEAISGNGDTIVSIIYNRNKYTVTLISSLGVTVLGDGNYLYGQTVLISAEVDDGYEWVKWESLDAQICPDGDFEDYAFNMPAADISFHAQAIKLDEPTPETFNITFKSYEDALISSQTITEGSRVPIPEDPIKEGHTFKGWSTNKDEYVEFDFQTLIASNFNLYAFFEANTYVVQFMDGEDIVLSAFVLYDSFVDSPEITPFKTGYTFKGWSINKDEYVEFDFQTVVINNINLYAFYEANTYVVQFVDEEDVISTVSVLYNDFVSKPELNPSKTGYSFKGWSNNKNEYIEFDFTSNIKENINLYAFYEANKLTVTFLNGMTIFALKEVNYNTNVTAPNYEPTQTGYNFIGWYTESEEKFDFNKEIITENVILYAKWTKKESPTHGGYMIIFDSNDGSYVSSQVIMQGSKVMKPINPTKAGYTFDGWYKDSSLDTVWNFGKDVVTGPMILYAKWIKTIEPTIEQYSITFNSNEGSAIASQRIMKGDKVTKPENPLKEGYNFEGWYQDSDLNTPWDFEEDLVTDTMTLYASWIKETEELSLEEPVTEKPIKKTSWIIVILIILLLLIFIVLLVLWLVFKKKIKNNKDY